MTHQKPTVAVTWPISEDALDRLREKAHVVVHEEERVLSPDALKKFVGGADAVLCLLTNKITAEVLESAGSQLKLVASMSAGYDHIDIDEASKRKIYVTNTPGVLDNAVAEHTIALILSLAKYVPSSDDFMRSGKYEGWDPRLFVGIELSGKVLGIVGLGRIGSVVAKVAGFGLGMAIAYTDIKPNQEFEEKFNAKYFSLDRLLHLSDVVTLHVPLLPSTKHLINAHRLSLMKPSAFLINTSRGPIVDESALVTALKHRRIAGAGLDVYEHEPELADGLKDLPNVVLTPHTASATFEAREAMAQRAVDNVLAVLAGHAPKDVVKAG